MTGSACAWLGKQSIGGRVGRALAPLTDMVLGRGFPANSRQRVHVYYTRLRISFSQIFPFLHYGPEISRTYGADIRYFEIERLLSGDLTPVGADVVMIQPWFDVDREVLVRALERVRGANPRARVVFLDSYAHNDLRLAKFVDPFIDLYVKKSLFRDRATYFKPTLGDTNLTDYYGWQYGCTEKRVDWKVPHAIVPKLRVGASFYTAPGLLEGFLAAPPNFAAERPIELHSRLMATGSGWYAGMRADCVRRTASISGAVLTGTGVPHTQFMEELGQSKMVFSPFGYGELCWRDIEGFLAGSVVVKQDMGHLETRPDLYRPWETYIPVAWDFSDLERNIARALRDSTLRQHIAETAWRATHRYLAEARFVTDMGFLFTDARPVFESTQAKLPGFAVSRSQRRTT